MRRTIMSTSLGGACGIGGRTIGSPGEAMPGGICCCGAEIGRPASLTPTRWRSDQARRFYRLPPSLSEGAVRRATPPTTTALQTAAHACSVRLA